MNKVVYTVSKNNPFKIEWNMLASTCQYRAVLVSRPDATI